MDEFVMLLILVLDLFYYHVYNMLQYLINQVPVCFVFKKKKRKKKNKEKKEEKKEKKEEKEYP